MTIGKDLTDVYNFADHTGGVEFGSTQSVDIQEIRVQSE